MSRRLGASRRVRLCVGVGLSAVFLTACKVDLTATINVAENGSGTVIVTATGDEEVLRAAPELVDSLNVDDLRDAGWDVTADVPNAVGGITVTVAREFATVDEATTFLSQLSGTNGPFRNMTITRTGGVNDATFELRGSGGLPNGLSDFADAEALAVLGEAPFFNTLTVRDVSVSEVLTVSLDVTLPGDLTSSTGEVKPRAEDDLVTTARWQIPADGTELPLEFSTRNRDLSAQVASVAATLFLGLMILLIVAAVIYLATVVQRRDRSAPLS